MAYRFLKADQKSHKKAANNPNRLLYNRLRLPESVPSLQEILLRCLSGSRRKNGLALQARDSTKANDQGLTVDTGYSIFPKSKRLTDDGDLGEESVKSRTGAKKEDFR